VRGGHERGHEPGVGGDLWAVGGRREGGARPDVPGQHHDAAGEGGSSEKAATATGPLQRRLLRADECHEREAGEKTDEDRGHHALAVAGKEVRELNGGGARRRQQALDEVGEDEQDRCRRAAEAQQPDAD